MAVACLGITGYDIRTTWKGVAAEALTMGMSVYLSAADTLIRRVDGVNTVCHGWALTTVAEGETVTIVTACRMEVDTAQIPGRRAAVGNIGAGTAPSTTFAGTGLTVGFGITTDQVWLHVPQQAAEV